MLAIYTFYTKMEHLPLLFSIPFLYVSLALHDYNFLKMFFLFHS